MLVTCQQMSAAESRLFSTGVSPEPYMDEAGRKCSLAIRQFFPTPATAEIFCGKGNNGGDALVVAYWLKRWGWKTNLHFSDGTEQISELARRKLEQYREVPDPLLDPGSRETIAVDGLLGIGASGALRGGIRDQADRMNALRHSDWAACFAIDIPTGLNGDTGEAYEGAVKADYTLTICQPKVGFVADSAVNFVGRLVEIPLDIPVSDGNPAVQLLFPSNLQPRLNRRPFDTHKGSAGRVTIIAGSSGLTGAAALAALGASRSGAGLVTVCVPRDIYPIVASQCPAEVMVQPIDSISDINFSGADVFAVGPGLGANVSDDLVDLIRKSPTPMIVDADALNALASRSICPSALPENRLLTPHPGELGRLTNHTGDRVSLTRQLADEWEVTLLHKGARTVIASPHHSTELNTTGHPGMASGGMGDVLTGACAAIAAQGIGLHDAACLGSWLLGRSAELAQANSQCAEESISAPMVAESLGQALRDLQTSSPR